MNKELLGFISLFIALFIGALYYTNLIQSPIVSVLNFIKISYNDATSYIEQTIDKHIFQTRQIETLQENVLQYEKNHFVMHQMAKEIQDLYRENNSLFKLNPDVALVRSISYSKMGDFNKVWLEFDDFNNSKIYGLVYKEMVAGIVVSHKNKPLALLNRDIKSSYSVTIGEQNAPGIAHGNNTENLLVKFIPSWVTIDVGDEVMTSGLDGIFFKGVKVGKVLSISSSQGYQSAIIEPYYKAMNPNYFHAIMRVR
ncbi:MAG: rod shape-determining protein MreC [Sulfurimonadaceae bacterium]|jgi:rod shape-determining protein MreC|nr:rod shape-determining protein MreC [Sulfurimonadaceae bacterium]